MNELRGALFLGSTPFSFTGVRLQVPFNFVGRIDVVLYSLWVIASVVPSFTRTGTVTNTLISIERRSPSC